MGNENGYGIKGMGIGFIQMGWIHVNGYENIEYRPYGNGLTWTWV